MNKVVVIIVLTWILFTVYYAFTDPSEEICTEEMSRRCQAQVICIGKLKDYLARGLKRLRAEYQELQLRAARNRIR